MSDAVGPPRTSALPAEGSGRTLGTLMLPGASNLPETVEMFEAPTLDFNGSASPASTRSSGAPLFSERLSAYEAPALHFNSSAREHHRLKASKRGSARSPSPTALPRGSARSFSPTGSAPLQSEQRWPPGLVQSSDRFQELLHELGREHAEAIQALNEELYVARGSNGLHKAEANLASQKIKASLLSPCPLDERDEPPTRQVEVSICSGHNLKNADLAWLGQKSDPYCVCHWKSDVHGKWRTPVIQNNLNPVWNHTLSIGSCRFDDELQFSVWDEDYGKKDDLLGRVSLPAYVFCTSGFEGNLPLKDAKGRTHGELRVKISIHEPARLIELKASRSLASWKASNRIKSDVMDDMPLDDTDMLSTAWRWELLVRLAVEAVYCEWRLPRPVWRRNATKGFKSKFLTKQATQRLTNIVQSAKDFDRRSLALPARRSTFLFMEISWKDSGWSAMDPHSRKRIFWTLIGMLFMIYDVIMIPMQVFVMPESIVFDTVMWLGQIFWTFDIIVNFFTGVYINSQLHTDLWRVARRYLSTWFLFDILVTIPTYIPLIAQDEVTSKEAALTQSMRSVMRIFRLMRLVRLCKFTPQMNETLEVINSPGLLLTINMLKHNMALIIWNHIVSCIWFWLGDIEKGWIVKSDVEGEDFSYRYLTSLHWTLAQYQGNSEIVPTTAIERAYAVLFLQVAMIILALFVSRLTNMMRQMQEIIQEKSAQHRSVCTYLAENQISSTLSVRVKKYVEWQRRFEKRRKEDEEVLLILPTPILMDLLEEVRGPVLQKHPFFSVFFYEFGRTCRRICHEAVFELTPAPGETVFAVGDQCSEMYFVRSGQLRYVAKPQSSISKVQRNYRQPVDQLDVYHDLGAGFEKVSLGSKNHKALAPVENAERVSQGFWLSEAVLWCEWEHCGDLTGLEDIILLSLQYEQFAHIVNSQSTAAITASLYARKFVAAFDRFGYVYTDLIDHNVLFDESSDDYRGDTDFHPINDEITESCRMSAPLGRESYLSNAFKAVSSVLGFGKERSSQLQPVELNSVMDISHTRKSNAAKLKRISSVFE